MWSICTHPWVWGGLASVEMQVSEVRSVTVCANVCSRQLMHHRRKKSGSYYISFIIHTMSFSFLILGVIGQACATVNVRYFPWGKRGLRVRGKDSLVANGPA